MEACGGGRDDCDPMQAYWVLELINKNLDADDRFIEGAWGNWDYRMLVVLVFMMFVGMLQRKYALSVTLESSVTRRIPMCSTMVTSMCTGFRA